jgi:homoprotocatechuate degradation regulator HpaR
MAEAKPKPPIQPESPALPVEASLPMALFRAREAVMRGFRRLLREQGLNEQEWRIIRALVEVDRIEIGELAERVFILKPSATRTIRNLEARKIVTRNRSSKDQRRAFISLTPLGREIFASFAPRSEMEYARITKLLGEQNMQQLYELLGRVTRVLNDGT